MAPRNSSISYIVYRIFPLGCFLVKARFSFVVYCTSAVKSRKTVDASYFASCVRSSKGMGDLGKDASR